MSVKKQVLILCTGNSCRSQMAEGLVRQLFGTQVDAYSAGTKPSFVHPKAIAVMKEIGSDISSYRSKHVEEFNDEYMDLVITVCGNADQACPTFLALKRVHWPFEDPAEATGTEDEILQQFRNVRDQIKLALEERLPQWL